MTLRGSFCYNGRIGVIYGYAVKLKLECDL